MGLQGIDSEAALDAWLERQGGGAHQLSPTGAVRRASTRDKADPLEELLDHIMALAREHGWSGQYTYNAAGPDAGLHISVVREVGIMAEVHRETEPLTASQQRWLNAWARIGLETYAWTPACREEIVARLSQRRTP